MDVDKKIAKFLKASNELERYMHEGGPLTPLQRQTIETTIMGVQTILQSWMRKQGLDELPSVVSRVTPRKAQES